MGGALENGQALDECGGESIGRGGKRVVERVGRGCNVGGG